MVETIKIKSVQPMLIIYYFICLQQIDLRDMENNTNGNNSHPAEDSPEWFHLHKQLSAKMSALEHEHKKIMIELQNDLAFEKKRAEQFEEKYKSAIKYKNEEQGLKGIISDINQKLKNKENQILDYIKSQQEKKKKIDQLDTANQDLSKNNEQMKQIIQQMKQGVISAIHQKDSIISSLQEKLIEFENVDTKKLQNLIVELEDKYQQLEQRSEIQKRQIQGLIEMKEEQLKQMKDKFQSQRQRYEEKISVLERDIISYEKHIERVNEERSHEQNLQQNYYLLEQKQRKTEKKLHQAEQIFKQDKQRLIQAIQKLQSELTQSGSNSELLKQSQNKLREVQKQLKTKKKEIEQSKSILEKTKSDYLKKITQLQQQKKKIQDSLDIRSHELERMRVQVEQNKGQKKDKKQSNAEQTTTNDVSLAHELDKGKKEEEKALVQKLKDKIKDLELHVQQLNTQLQEQIKQVQLLRQKLVSTSGSAGRSDGQAQLLVQIQDLNSYIKKVEHNLMITKLKKAEDESYWSTRQSQMKKQIQKIDKKCKKQKVQLLERIDRMKKTNVNNKKTDYYQSSLK